MEKPDYTWLKTPRTAKKLSQEALAAALNVDVKNIRRWERCETCQGIPFARLAGALGVDEHALKESQQNDLQAKQAYEKWQTWQKEALPINDKQIKQALTACEELPFYPSFLVRLNVDNTDQAHKCISKYIKESEIARCGQAFKDGIALAKSDAELDLIWRLVSAIALNCVTPDSEFAKAGVRDLEGRTKVWVIRLCLDRVLGNPVTGVCFKPLYGLDDDETLAVRFDGATTEANVLGQCWERVMDVHETLQRTDERPPDPRTDPQAFEDYCTYLNAELLNSNEEECHIFTVMTQQLADEVLEKLMGYLPALRLFACLDAKAAHGLLRMDETTLGNWIGRLLGPIEDQKAKLKGLETSNLEEQGQSLKNASGHLEKVTKNIVVLEKVLSVFMKGYAIIKGFLPGAAA